MKDVFQIVRPTYRQFCAADTSRGVSAPERNFTPRHLWDFHTEEEAENWCRIPAFKQQHEWGSWVWRAEDLKWKSRQKATQALFVNVWVKPSCKSIITTHDPRVRPDRKESNGGSLLAMLVFIVSRPWWFYEQSFVLCYVVSSLLSVLKIVILMLARKLNYGKS